LKVSNSRGVGSEATQLNSTDSTQNRAVWGGQERLNCHRATLYNYLDRYPELQDHRRIELGASRGKDCGSYGPAFRHRVRAMGITEVITAARSPWQNPYVERVIGSIRRECLDHVVILNERHLRRVLSSYLQYHHDARTHLSLNKDCPRPRPIQPPSAGNIMPSRRFPTARTKTHQT
jgi:Integrase core domain